MSSLSLIEGRLRPSSGIGLIEVLIVLTIFGIVIGVIGGLKANVEAQASSQSLLIWTTDVVTKVRTQYRDEIDYRAVTNINVAPLLDNKYVVGAAITGPHQGQVNVTSCSFNRGLFGIAGMGPDDCFTVQIGGLSQTQCNQLANGLASIANQVFIGRALVKGFETDTANADLISRACNNQNNSVAISVV